jgi:hypothetical protein
VSLGTMDAEKQEFVENYGHINFQYINFVPKIKTKKELIKENFKMLKKGSNQD